MTKKLKSNSAMIGFTDGDILAEIRLKSIINQAVLISAGNSPFDKEIGGKIIISKNDILLTNLRNYSDSKKRFISELPETDIYDENLLGFWHTHPSYSIPSPVDFYQMMKLNILFKKNFLMIIIGRRKISITKFKYFIFPVIKFNLIRSGM